MKLWVIEGGKHGSGDDVGPRVPLRPIIADVQAEGRRRVRRAGYDAWCVREFATGIPMPKSIRYLQMQITFAADALARLDNIPEDFRSDVYWPAG